jgi:23S rRNA pseudouridine2605 synthase
MSDKPDRPARPRPPAKAAATDAPEGDRIAKVLSRAGIASRREAERMIELGQVTVNGKVISSPALNVTAKDRITVAGQPLGEPDPPRLWLYYKPEGLVTSAADEKGRETVFDRLPPDMPRVMSVGRLDLNSEGLLLLTNDGELKRRLELPSTGWLRKYRVRVKGNPVDPDLEPLRKGITVEGERFQPMTVTLDRVQGANAWLTVGLREGKNREIRRAMTAIGLTVNRLIRVSYGPFRLGDMQPGAVEEVRTKVLRDQLGLDPAAEDATGTATRKPRPARDGAAKPAARKPAPGPDGAPSKTAAKPHAGPKPPPGTKARPTVKTWSTDKPGSATGAAPAAGPRSGSKQVSTAGAGTGSAPRNAKPTPAPRRPRGGPAPGPKGPPRRGT